MLAWLWKVLESQDKNRVVLNKAVEWSEILY